MKNSKEKIKVNNCELNEVNGKIEKSTSPKEIIKVNNCGLDVVNEM